MLYTDELEKLAKNIVENSPELSHIQMENILILGKFDRGTQGGTIAVCNCIKLKGTHKMLDLRFKQHTIKYFIEFSFPRFINQPASEQLKTIVHELYHIAPEFDGTLRKARHGRAFENEVLRITEKYFLQFGYPYFMTKSFEKIRFLRWKKKPRYSAKKLFYDEEDIRISSCEIKKYEERLKYVYRCPACGQEYFLKKKPRGLNLYFCRICLKKGDIDYHKSHALVFSRNRV